MCAASCQSKHWEPFWGFFLCPSRLQCHAFTPSTLSSWSPGVLVGLEPQRRHLVKEFGCLLCKASGSGLWFYTSAAAVSHISCCCKPAPSEWELNWFTRSNDLGFCSCLQPVQEISSVPLAIAFPLGPWFNIGPHCVIRFSDSIKYLQNSCECCGLNCIKDNLGRSDLI